MPIDVDAARAITPACTHVVHLNNAGAAPSPTPVVDRVVAHLRREAEIGGYEAAAEARDEHDAVYASVARLVNGSPDEVALVESATRAWDSAFLGLRFEPGDRILTGRAEYASNAIAMLQVAERTGAVIEVVDDDEHGQLSVADLAERLDERVALIALTHVPTNGGLVNPVAEVGRIARDAGIPYLLDACQSAGQLHLDVEKIGCDILTGTGRKFLRGPRGTGFAWVRREFIERLHPYGLDLYSASWTGPATYTVRSDARRLETFESSLAGRLGLGVAVDYALELGLDQIEARVVGLAAGLRRGLEAIDGVTVHDQGVERCAIVTFTVEGHGPDDVQGALFRAGINVWVSRLEQAQFDLPLRGLADIVRASPHYFNTEAELDTLVEAVAALLP